MKHQTLLIALLIVIALGSGIGVVYTHHRNRLLFMQWQKVQAERDQIASDWELLQLEQSTLVTNIAIQDTARTRLNMLNPDPGAVLYISP